MNYMFKDVEDLFSAEMTTNGNCQVTSMISSFENCKNLDHFNITGFGATQLKSTHKLFYNSGLKHFNFDKVDTINLEDISYMFAGSQIDVFEFSSFTG